MIMWELMTGRRPFWDQAYDTDLMIQIIDGARPTIVTNAPTGYIELMQKCWDSNPNKRPITSNVRDLIDKIILNDEKSPTKMIISSDIGPIIKNDLDSLIHSSSASILTRRSIKGKYHYLNHHHSK